MHSKGEISAKYVEMDNEPAAVIPSEKVNRKARVIVRNLPFKGLSEESVKKIFQEYGVVQSVNLLKKDNGQFVGCGFVQFANAWNAGKAIAAVNGRDVKGRPIIVDWALPKNTFLQKVETLKQEKIIKKEMGDDCKMLEYSIDRKPTHGNERDSYSDTDDELGVKKAEDEDEDDEEEDGEDDDNLDKEDDNNVTLQRNKKVKQFDVDEGKTIFIKNLPFSATQEDLKACFEQYGDIIYALVCVDPVTEHSRGTAFVKFKESESAQKCIKESSKIYLHEYPLGVHLAVSKEQLNNKKNVKKSSTVKDARNLYLLREGVIMAGSKAAQGVSSADMTKRLDIERWKSQMLRNLNMFVSNTRLIIHNLPSTYNDIQLKALFVKHSNPRARITEARVVRSKSVDSEGLGLSKEFGFVGFTAHDDAITALRNINNSPDMFTRNRRPIVGFSVENKTILNLKQKRVERSRAKQGLVATTKLKEREKLNKKQRRAVKRKENLIRKRQEQKKSKTGDTTAKQLTTNSAAKRKSSETNNGPSKKAKIMEKKSKQRKQNPADVPGDVQFSGETAVPGKQVVRSNRKLQEQFTKHAERKKQEKSKRKRDMAKMKRKKEPTKAVTKKDKDTDDRTLTELISRYKNKIESSSSFKKWYES